jgi:hypothetical protein
MRIFAVDWSGKAKGERESIWLAEVCDRELVSLENGRSREELVAHIVAVADKDPQFVVGFDFALSFPRWWCEAQGWRTPWEVWSAMSRDGERLLAACQNVV